MVGTPDVYKRQYLARLSGTDADMPDLYVLKMAENSIVYAADPAGGEWTEYAVFTGEKMCIRDRG